MRRVMRRAMRRGVVLAALAVLVVIVAAAALVGQARIDRLTGYYSPIYGDGGRSVYFIKRETTGLSFGLGYEHFTPPAYAYALGDTLSLHRLDVASGAAMDSDVPLFDIADAEMSSGIFSDIERAIASPGTATGKDMGDYVIHHDYQNSARINALLDGGGERFQVRYAGRVYELTVERP